MVQIPDFLKISMEWLCTISSCFVSDQDTTKRNQNGTKRSINIHLKLNLSELLLKSFRGSVIIFHFYPDLILTFTGLNEVGPPQSFSSVIQYSQLDASFGCLFIYAQTCLSHYPLNLENLAQIN